MSPVTIVGVSLKMYFSHARTVQYCRDLAELASRTPALADGRVQLVVMPTYPSLTEAVSAVQGSGVRIGAQDLAAADEGAWTGEVSGAVLAEIGCTAVEVGHAERRTHFGEDEATVAAKAAAALRAGLVPWLCVGEKEVATAQEAARTCVAEVLSAVGGARRDGLRGRVVVAYEPHWAIGAPSPAPTEYVAQVCRQTRERLAGELDDFAIVYGGSAGPGLLRELGDSVDGVFLGRFAHNPAAVGDVVAEAVER